MFPQRAACRTPSSAVSISAATRSRSSTRAPRAWRPTQYGQKDYAAFNEAFADSRLQSVVIHAVYLINTATPDREIREKSLSVARARAPARRRDRRRRRRPPRRLAQAGPRSTRRSRARARSSARCSPSPSGARSCSRTPPAPRARSAATSTSSAMLVDAAGGGERIGVCIDCCHLFASGFEIVEPDGLSSGRRRPRPSGSGSTGCGACTSTTAPSRWAPTATSTPTSARARWAPRGSRPSSQSRASRSSPPCSRPRGPRSAGADAAEVQRAKELREQGLAARGA